MSVNEESYSPVTEIGGKELREMIVSSLMWLKEQQSLIDSLNVFPVPDGDTGTNMYLTYLDAVKAVKKEDSNEVSSITESLARGALMGARGNSGVILSQLLRGFSQAHEDSTNITPDSLAKGLKLASEVAYQGVLKPVEGTILTVSRKAAEGAEEALDKNSDLMKILQHSVHSARIALENTPEQLPALKEADVVDAGGKGYLTILEGLLRELKGEKNNVDQVDLEVVKSTRKKQPKQELDYTYCTQTLLYTNENNKYASIDNIRNDLQNYGDSLLVVGSDNVIKIHIHTNNPGSILEYALELGSLGDISIENMERQQEHNDSPEISRQLSKNNNDHTTKNLQENEANTIIDVDKNIGLVAVGQGDGIKNILKDLGVDIVIEGGQSMNPSTNDFVEAMDQLDVNQVILLPNNKNVISAAKQAVSVTDKEAVVVKTKTIPEAVSSLLVFNDQAKLEDLQEAMEDEANFVKTAEITKAVKDSKVEGMEISEGDIIGLLNGKIEVVGKSYHQVVLKLFKECWEDEDLITIYYGENVDKEQADKLRNKLIDKLDLDEIELYNGGQPLYPYIISLE